MRAAQAPRMALATPRRFEIDRTHGMAANPIRMKHWIHGWSPITCKIESETGIATASRKLPTPVHRNTRIGQCGMLKISPMVDEGCGRQRNNTAQVRTTHQYHSAGRLTMAGVQSRSAGPRFGTRFDPRGVNMRHLLAVFNQTNRFRIRSFDGMLPG